LTLSTANRVMLRCKVGWAEWLGAGIANAWLGVTTSVM